ncbi:hypothetical protein BCR32DRAFT_269299 [Anaeromyces robustus]|uniref:BZIP domain-containing protein n=1 Tax=Anaeromyces robustus TaxID=1754192 RepID=A0A1Y1X1R3_9FUNG|nr:hypothetical protein BCR32DRAFT_269299 [Anaeromyces robustus]|eukprot:ORX79713.1 hypothetical protein BCR32DRAFT_269299 [Anaeromyces robustus]
MNYLNKTSEYYNTNDNNAHSVNTTNSTPMDTNSYQNNNNSVNNNSIYLASNNIEDHELDLWLREFTMDNFPLNRNKIPNDNSNNNNNNQSINNNRNEDENNLIESQYNSSNIQNINHNSEFIETAAQDKYLKIRKLKNVAIEDRAKKNGEMDNYSPNLSLLPQFNIVNNTNTNDYNSNNNNNNKSYLNEASTSMDIYKTNSAYTYHEGYKSISQLPHYLINERLNENRQSQQYSNNSYNSNEFVINKKDNIFDVLNMVNSPVEKDLPFLTNSSNSIANSPELDNKISSGKGKELSVEEKLNDKRKRNNAASARFRAKKKLKEQMTDLTAKEMTQKAQSLEIKVKEMELEIKWLRSLVTKNMESKTLKEVYEENGYLFINENDESQNSQSTTKDGQKLVSISDSVKSYSKCCCNIDKSKGGTCGKNGTIGHCKCGGIGYCLMNVNINKNKKIIKPKIAANQYPPISKSTI